MSMLSWETLRCFLFPWPEWHPYCPSLSLASSRLSLPAPAALDCVGRPARSRPPLTSPVHVKVGALKCFPPTFSLYLDIFYLYVQVCPREQVLIFWGSKCTSEIPQYLESISATQLKAIIVFNHSFKDLLNTYDGSDTFCAM